MSIYFPKLYIIIHKVIMDKKYHVNSDKNKIATSPPLKHIILGNQHRLPIQHMANKLVTDILTKIMFIKFQFEFISGTRYNQHNQLQEQMFISMSTASTGRTITVVRRVLFQENNYVSFSVKF